MSNGRIEYNDDITAVQVRVVITQEPLQLIISIDTNIDRGS